MFFAVLIPALTFGQTERFINPNKIDKKIVKTNTSTPTAQESITTNINVVTNIQTNISTNIQSSNQTEQEIIDYIQSQEERNAQIRSEQLLQDIINNPPITEEDPDIFDLPEQVHKFEPIDAIILDAGHGGKDPGGSSNGIQEKRLVLTMVKKIHTLLRKNNRKLKIYVTRKNDSFVSLEDRVSKTARWSSKRNVLFVSIHGNISLRPSIFGFEIYTLSDRASDTEALATERLENAGFSPEDIVQTDTIYSLLADLIRDGTRKESEWLAQYIYEDTLKTSGVFGRGLKRANFFVLKYNTVPSVLLEIGYMSNKAEAEKLKSEEYQNKLAIGIYKGIIRYIQEYNKSEGFTK